jgi:hypothetical protein
MLDRMLLRLYAYPILLLVASPTAGYFLGVWIPSRFAGPVIEQLGQQAASIAPWISGGLLIGSLLWGAYSTLRFWRWYQGTSEETCCHVCGGLVDMKEGRYGLYYKCLACGKTRSA